MVRVEPVEIMARPLTARFNGGLAIIVAIIAIGVLADGAVIVTHLRSSTHSQTQSSAPTGAGAKAATHPCNHGFYVSQAAHAHKGGAYVKQVANSDLGKNGSCSAPLPAPAKGGAANPGDD